MSLKQAIKKILFGLSATMIAGGVFTSSVMAAVPNPKRANVTEVNIGDSEYATGGWGANPELMYGLHPIKGKTTFNWEGGCEVYKFLRNDNLPIYVIYKPTTAQSGKPVCKIKNAGVYKGEYFDAKVTFSWPKVKANKATITPLIQFGVADNWNRYGLWFRSSGYDAHFEFYQSGSNFKTKKSINMTEMIEDIDCAQAFGFKPESGTAKYFSTKDATWYATTQNVTNTAVSTGTREWFYSYVDTNYPETLPSHGVAQMKNTTGFYLYVEPARDNSKTVFSYPEQYATAAALSKYKNDWQDKMVASNDVVLMAFNKIDSITGGFGRVEDGALYVGGADAYDRYRDGWNIEYLGIGAGWYGAIVPDITKQVKDKNGNNIKNNNLDNTLAYTDTEYKYILNVHVPYCDPDYYFTALDINDTLPVEVKAKAANQITIENLTNPSIAGTTLFNTPTVSANGRTIKITAKNTSNASLYDSDFRITIPVTLNKNEIYKKSPVTSRTGREYSWTNGGGLTGQANDSGVFDGRPTINNTLTNAYVHAKVRTTSAGANTDKYRQSNTVTVYYPLIKNKVKVIKKDEFTGAKLDGATFELRVYNAETNKYERVSNLTRTAAGEYITGDLMASSTNPDGKFRIVETVAPGSHEAGSIVNITINNINNNTQEVTVTNPHSSIPITITKKDFDSETNTLSGAVFYLIERKNGAYNWATKVQIPETPAGSGIYKINATPAVSNDKGHWRIVETKAPDGYELDMYTTRIVEDANGKYVVVKDIDINTGTTDDKSVNISWLNPEKVPKGVIHLTKKDGESGEKLEGAIFNVYSWDSAANAWSTEPYEQLTYNPSTKTYDSSELPRYDKVYHTKTGSTPKLSRKRNDGRYLVREIKQPDGYINNNWSHEFVISDQADKDTIATANIFNEDVPNTPNHLIIVKKNRNEVPLNGVKFEFGKTQSEVTEYTTGAGGVDGTIDIPHIKAGNYVLREKSTIEGYDAETDWIQVSVSADGQIHLSDNKRSISLDGATVTYTRYNNHAQPLELIKRDSSDNSRTSQTDTFMYGAKFTVYEWSSTTNAYKTTPYGTLYYNKTNQEPKKTFVSTTTKKRLVLVHTPDNQGKFRIIETAAAPGFLLSQTTKDFQIAAVPTNNEEPFEVTMDNDPNKVILHKVNLKNETITGAKFVLYRTGGEAAFRTLVDDDNDGYVESMRLEPGVWNYQETEAPEGYALDDTIYQFTVAENGLIEGEAVKTITVKNKKKKDLKVVKRDKETGEVADLETNFPEGTEFDIYEWNEAANGWNATPSDHVTYGGSH